MSGKVSHPLFARLYPHVSAYADAHGSLEHRRELLAGARGRAVEIGAGIGSNFRHYPAEVERVFAVEPEPRLRSLAARAAATARIPIEVLPGRAERLPLDEASVDVAVTSLVLCTIADVPAALGEVLRVLKPTGELRFYEHVRAQDPRVYRRQRMLNPLWRLVGGGCNVTRDTETAIRRAGFTIETVRRFEFRPDSKAYPASPSIIGTARPSDAPDRRTLPQQGAADG
ncbi:class I SAM-dependent methyltransferase [Streptomyces sp. NPDC056149]|uniref:class I SAM-dependent methyltransferase n=1 Tax=Streptomyces sp. NPDC056149 TaxID=3345728 RepID=UPI0035D80684